MSPSARRDSRGHARGIPQASTAVAQADYTGRSLSADVASLARERWRDAAVFGPGSHFPPADTGVHDDNDWCDFAVHREVPGISTELDYHQCDAGRRTRVVDRLDQPRVFVVGDEQRELDSTRG